MQVSQHAWLMVAAAVGEAELGALRRGTFERGRPDGAVPWCASAKGAKCPRFPREAVRKHGCRECVVGGGCCRGGQWNMPRRREERRAAVP